MPEETRRARQRRELVTEIKTIARAQLEAGGRAGVSWRGIARAVGMNPASLYTYFASLDELFTALILDSYGSLAETTERAAQENPRRSAVNRAVEVALAYRAWALEHRSQYNLIFTDVLPGYEAPAGGPTVDAQRRVFAPLIELIFGLPPGDADKMPVGPAEEQAFIELFGTLHGMVTLEVNHHLDWVESDVETSVERFLRSAVERHLRAR